MDRSCLEERELNNDCRVDLAWSPEGRRKRGSQRARGGELSKTLGKDLGWISWNEVEQGAKDRDGWKTLLGSLMRYSQE